MPKKRRCKKVKIDSMPPIKDSIDKTDLCCSICKEIPKANIFQCKNSHLICSKCHTKLTDSEKCECPVCRTKMSRDNPCRSRLAENIVGKMVVKCPHTGCAKHVANEELPRHARDSCAFRPAHCAFAPLGCDWRGPLKSKHAHEALCDVRALTAPALLELSGKRARERESNECRRRAAAEADRLLAAALSSRCRDIRVHHVRLDAARRPSTSSTAPPPQELGPASFWVFGAEFSLELEPRRRPSAAKSSSPQTTLPKSSALKRKELEAPGETLRFKISLVNSSGEKLRLEGFLLPGDEETVDFRPAPFRLTSSPGGSSAVVAVAVGHEGSRRFDSDSTATFRVVLLNKNVGKSEVFARGNYPLDMSGSQTDDDGSYEDDGARLYSDYYDSGDSNGFFCDSDHEFCYCCGDRCE